MLDLSDITIVSANTRDPESSVKAIERSSKFIKFGKYLLLSDRLRAHDFIESRLIPKIKSKQDYSYFCVKELNRHIETDYCLVVQPDGFATNPLMWTDEYFKYDYIGAPWDYSLSRKALLTCGIDYGKINKPVPIIIGNGGFSLRSKRFLREASLLDYQNIEIPEDNFLCVLARKTFREKGIKYANLAVAKQFSLEMPIHMNVRDITIDAHFGFHGKYHHNKPLLDLLEDYDKDIEPVRMAKLLFN